MDPAGAYLETPAVCRLAGLPYATLDYWIRTGLVTPSVRASEGRRVPRRWTVADAVTVRAMRELRQAGCSVRTMRRAKEILDADWEPALRARALIWDGGDLLRVGSWNELSSVLAHPGQAVFKLVALPLDLWVRETEAEVVQIAAPQAGGYRTRSA